MAVVAGGLFLAWIVAGFLLRGLSSGEVLSGTSMSGVALGGSSKTEAAEKIDSIEPPVVELQAPKRSFEVPAPEAGLDVDVAASTEEAYDAGRSGIGAILGGPVTALADRDLEPVYEPVDQKRLKRAVRKIAKEVDRPPFPGALDINRQSLEVRVESPEAGAEVERRKTRDALLAAFESGSESVELPIDRRPAPNPGEVRAVQRKAERYLQTPLTIRTGGGPLKITRRQLAGLLILEQKGKGGLRLSADPEEVEKQVADIARRRDFSPKNAKLDTPSSPPVTVTEQGDFGWSPRPGVATIKKGRDGRRIRRNRAADAMTDAVQSGKHTARFPTNKIKPSVSNDELKGGTSLLGTFTTSYTCCEPRVTNIQQMAKTVDGTVIAPGEQFSLNGVAGERTKANGYKPAPTIGEGNKLIDTVGGGVSQFSTTTYNAAYFAGVQIDAHTPHSFYISRYPPGRESTLNFGTIDLLWTNTTGTPIVVRSSAGDTSVTVSLYGKTDTRRVKAETQSRTDNSKGAFDITIDRVVISKGGSRARDSYTTSYGTPAE